MKTLLKSIILLFGLIISIESHALQMDYYTYGGFDTIVSAFERMALIYGDNQYWVVLGVIMVLGMVMAALTNYLKPLMGGQASSLIWIAPTILGAVIFMGTIAPKGTIHVYDTEKNAYQAVANIPDAIILVAGFFNKIERVMVNVTDTASAYPYTLNSNGSNFKLIFDALSPNIKTTDYHLRNNISSYYYACSPIAIATGRVKRQDIFENTSDLKSELEKMQNLATFVDMYSDANPAGTSVSCTDAWTTYLNTQLNDVTKFDNMLNNICGQSGFNTNDAAQLTRCKEELQQAYNEHGVVPSSAINYLRNKQLAFSILAAIDQTDPDAAQRRLLNRNLIINGIGAMNAAQETLPTIKAVTTAIVIGMVPFLSLFLVTGLIRQASTYIIGAFAWLAIWGAMVAIAHAGAMDEALHAFNAIRDQKMGINAILGGEEASIKAMAIFGRMQTMSLLIATSIAMVLFKFGGYALSQVAQAQAENLQRLGEDSAQKTLTPEGRDGQRLMVQKAIANQAAYEQHGNEGMIMGMQHSAVSQAATGSALNATGNASQISNTAGIKQAAQLSGNYQALLAASNQNGTSIFTEAQKTEFASTLSQLANKDNILEQANRVGNGNAVEGLQNITKSEQTQRASQAQEMLNIYEKLGNGDINRGSDIMAQISAGKSYGEATAYVDNAKHSDTSVDNLASTTQQTKTQEQISDAEQKGNSQLNAGNGNSIFGQDKISASKEGQSYANTLKNQNYAQAVGLDSNSPDDIRRIAENRGQNNNALALSQSQLQNTPFYDKANNDQKEYIDDPAYSNKTFLVDAGFNEDGSISQQGLAVREKLNSDESTNINKDNINSDKTVNDSSVKNLAGTTYENGIHVSGAIMQTAILDNFNLNGSQDAKENWVNDYAAFAEVYDLAKSNPSPTGNQAREELIQESTWMFKDKTGSIDKGDNLSFGTKESISGGLKILGTGVSGSGYSNQETLSQDRTSVNAIRNQINDIYENTNTAWDFKQQVAGLHANLREHAIGKANDSDISDFRK